MSRFNGQDHGAVGTAVEALEDALPDKLDVAVAASTYVPLVDVDSIIDARFTDQPAVAAAAEAAVAEAADGLDILTQTVAAGSYASIAALPDLVATVLADDPTLREEMLDQISALTLDELDLVSGSAFEADPTTDDVLFSFPNNVRYFAGDLLPAAYEVNPASYPASTNLSGQTVSTGTGTITVRSGGTGGVVATTADQTGMTWTAGTTSPVIASVEVPSIIGASCLTVKALNAIGTGQGFGPFICGRFVTGDVRALRVAMSGTSRVYVLQKWSGPANSSATSTTLVASTRVAQVGDRVAIELREVGENLALVLLVNEEDVISHTLSSSDRTLFADPTYKSVGFYVSPSTTPTSPAVGKWNWTTREQVAQERHLVSTGPDRRLPAAVLAASPHPVYDIRDYGAAADGIVLTDAAATAGQPTVTSAARPFVTADVGKSIAVMGAGPLVANANDKVWLSTIVSVTAGVATLASNASTTISGARCVFGTPDDDAFAAAQVAAVAAGGGTVYIPKAHTIVTRPLNVQDYVSWTGQSRELSWVHVLMDRPGNGATAGVTDWLTCAGRSAANPLIGAHFSDFGVEAEAMIHTEGYGSAIKPLNIYYVKRCSIQRMNVWHTPATAIPFDHSYEQVVIRDNLIISPGRLAPSGVGPGGSGIGAGTKGIGSVEPTLIANNVIIGTHSASVAGPGHNGIFTEAQTGADPDLGVPGYRIINNVVIGMPFGISDTGSTGSLIEGNTIVGCGAGVRLAKTTLPAAYPGLHAIITKNTIRGCTGPGATDGTGVTIQTSTSAGTNMKDYLHTIVEGNQIIDNKSWGVSVAASGGGGIDVTGVMVHGNQIRGNGRSGVRLASGPGLKLRFPSVKDNQIAGNGKAAVAGDQAGVLIASGTVIEGGRIQDNDIYDLAAVPTQTATIVQTGATLTGVRIQGNTGDA